MPARQSSAAMLPCLVDRLVGKRDAARGPASRLAEPEVALFFEPVEEPPSGTEHDRVHDEAILVDRAAPRQGLHDSAAAIDHDVAAGFVLELRDLVGQWALERPRIVPLPQGVSSSVEEKTSFGN
jgi:hypothetical protein